MNASPSTVDPWQPTGSMTIGRASPRAIPLDDGRVLAIGDDFGVGVVRDDSSTAELWDPLTGLWSRTASVGKPRADFVALPLADGTVVVAGGLNQGPTATCGGQGRQSFSSSLVYDPTTATWAKTGLMTIARTAAAGAVLSDGRVLVAGGYYEAGRTVTGAAPEMPDAASVVFHAGAAGSDRRGTGGPGPNALDPSTVVPAVPSAELFDPGTRTWSPTGSMAYARLGAAAVTLTDGTVLVVGSGPYVWAGWDHAAAADPGAYESAEVYDPTIGTFRLTGRLPAIDRAAVAALGVTLPPGDGEPGDNGTLIALADGGALLVGETRWWPHLGELTRSFRYEATTGSWREVGRAWAFARTTPASPWTETPTMRRLDALVARLPDGRVLVAGGGGTGWVAELPPTRSAELYDPTTDSWTTLRLMPQARAGGAAVTLGDGSVLLLGGYTDPAQRAGSCEEGIGLSSAVRFVPTP